MNGKLAHMNLLMKQIDKSKACQNLFLAECTEAIISIHVHKSPYLLFDGHKI